MSSLYQLSSEYVNAINHAMDFEELNDETVKALDSLECLMEDKAIAIAHYIRNYESEAEMVKSAITEMQERAKRLEKKSIALSQYLCENLKKSNIREIRKNPNFVIKLKQNPHRVVVDNEDVLSTDYLKIVVKKLCSIDKIKLIQDLKMGKEVPGAHLEQDTRIEIK